MILFVHLLVPGTSLVAHLCAALVGFGFELGLLKFLRPPERVLRWLEAKLNLLGRVPHFVSVERTTVGRYGVLPSTTADVSVRNFMMSSTPRRASTPVVPAA